MKFLLILICVSFSFPTIFALNNKFFKGKWFNSYSKVNAKNDVKEYWFEQRLDHFNPTNIKTWQQRYFINDTFYKPGGPVLLMVNITCLFCKRS